MADRMQLMLAIGGVVTAPAPQQLTDALQSVQVTTAVRQRSGFQLTFAMSKRSVLAELILPTGLLDPPTRVILTAIVAGVPNVLMDGVVTRHEVSPSDTPGGTTLTVTGEDLTVLMDMDHVRQCYPAMPLNIRVLTILLKYALYGIVPAPVPAVIFSLKTPIEEIPIQADTDLNYINALASEAGYAFYLIPGPLPGVSTAYWGPEVRAGLVQPALTVDTDSAGDVESLSFSFDGLSRTQYAVALVEPTTKIGISVPIPDVSLLRPPLALRPAATLRHEPVPNQAGRSLADVLLTGLAKTAHGSDAVTGNGRLDVLRYGHVLQPRSLVGVRGAGLAYDGLWYVTSVTHDIKRGEYKQSVRLARVGFVAFGDRVSA
jgi:hypothetical protein